MTYYKGYIVSNKVIESYKYQSLIGEQYRLRCSYDIIFSNKILKSIPKTIEDCSRKLIYSCIENDVKKIEIKDENIIKYLNENYSFNNNEMFHIINNLNYLNTATTEIIYELVKDMEGNLFGKELYTGELFPIYSDNNKDFNYELLVEKKKLKGSIETYECHYSLEIIPEIKISTIPICKQLIVNSTIASKKDIFIYQNRFNKKGIFKSKYKKEEEQFKDKIISKANENAFSDNFQIQENKPKKIELERQNMETSLMEEIEYNLLKLKNTNQDLYTEYKQKYDDLLTKNINKEVLAFLLGEIEFSLVFKKRDIEDILEFIDNLKREYLDNFLNNPDVKTELNLKKLNKINELFLKVKDKYNYKNQRDVLNNLAFLYLMEVYENRDIITLQELEQSYFCTHLKSIIMWINLLMEENIIECNYIFSLQEDINVKVVFNMINSIKFNNKAKEKVKKII